MEQKYFMHRIKLEEGANAKGIEVHDTLDAAILSYHAYMGLWAYGNPEKPNVTFVHCKITDIFGNIVNYNGTRFDAVWKKRILDPEQVYFMHHIRKDGDTYAKDIDIFSTGDEAVSAYHNAMAYGYDNSRHPNVTYVSCEITSTVSPDAWIRETWVKPETVPEETPEEEPEE